MSIQRKFGVEGSAQVPHNPEKPQSKRRSRLFFGRSKSDEVQKTNEKVDSITSALPARTKNHPEKTLSDPAQLSGNDEKRQMTLDDFTKINCIKYYPTGLHNDTFSQQDVSKLSVAVTNQYLKTYPSARRSPISKTSKKCITAHLTAVSANTIRQDIPVTKDSLSYLQIFHTISAWNTSNSEVEVRLNNKSFYPSKSDPKLTLANLIAHLEKQLKISDDRNWKEQADWLTCSTFSLEEINTWVSTLQDAFKKMDLNSAVNPEQQIWDNMMTAYSLDVAQRTEFRQWLQTEGESVWKVLNSKSQNKAQVMLGLFNNYRFNKLFADQIPTLPILKALTSRLYMQAQTQLASQSFSHSVLSDKGKAVYKVKTSSDEKRFFVTQTRTIGIKSRGRKNFQDHATMKVVSTFESDLSGTTSQARLKVYNFTYKKTDTDSQYKTAKQLKFIK